MRLTFMLADHRIPALACHPALRSLYWPYHSVLVERTAMSSINPSLIGSRRELLRSGGAIAAGALLGNVFSPRSFAESAPAAGMAEAPQSTAPANARSSSALAQARAEMAKTPLQTLKLRENIYMLYGPGGNMVLLTGPDGKVLVDTGVAPVAAKLKQTLAGLSNAPLKLVIDSH